MIACFVRSTRLHDFNTKQQARTIEGHGAGKIGRFARRITFGREYRTSPVRR